MQGHSVSFSTNDILRIQEAEWTVLANYEPVALINLKEQFEEVARVSNKFDYTLQNLYISLGKNYWFITPKCSFVRCKEKIV